MIRDTFRIMVVDLTVGRGNIVTLEGRDKYVGGSGLAALLFSTYGHADRPWNDPDQPLIFTIGPLTGYFPLMSKTVCAFRSPYHDQFAESHGGGRSALALRFADLDALVVVGRAARPSCIAVGSHNLIVKELPFLWGKDVFETGKMIRGLVKRGGGHRTILRIGPAGENGSAMAGINVDTYRHFGRLGGGAVMGSKNLKAIVIEGDASFSLPESREYPKVFQEVYAKVTGKDMMKYHDIGTPINMAVLNETKMLPIRNLQRTTDPGMAGITGEQFAENALLRNGACSGCGISHASRRRSSCTRISMPMSRCRRRRFRRVSTEINCVELAVPQRRHRLFRPLSRRHDFPPCMAGGVRSRDCPLSRSGTLSGEARCHG